MFKVEVIKTLDEFRNLREQWNCLLAQSRADTLFLSWEWLYTWWEIYGNKYELCILLSKNTNGTICGIGPLMIQNKYLGFKQFRLIEFIGNHSVSSEYLDFICLRTLEKEVIASFILYLVNSKDWDLLFFFRIPKESVTISLLNSFIKSKQLYFHETKIEESLFVSLTSNWDDFVSTLGKNTKHNIKRYRKRFEEQLKGNLIVLKNYNSCHLGDIIFLQQYRMKRLGKVGSFSSSSLRQFHDALIKRITEKGWLRMFYLTTENKRIGALYGFCYQNKFYAYSMGINPEYEKDSIGFVLLSYCIENCIKEGIKEIDLFSPHDYKERWKPQKKMKLRCVIGLSKNTVRLYQYLTMVRYFIKSKASKLLTIKFYQKVRNIKKIVLILFNKPLR